MRFSFFSLKNDENILQKNETKKSAKMMKYFSHFCAVKMEWPCPLLMTTVEKHYYYFSCKALFQAVVDDALL